MKTQTFRYDDPRSSRNGGHFALVPRGAGWAELFLPPGATEWEEFTRGTLYKWVELEPNDALKPVTPDQLPVPLPSAENDPQAERLAVALWSLRGTDGVKTFELHDDVYLQAAAQGQGADAALLVELPAHEFLPEGAPFNADALGALGFSTDPDVGPNPFIELDPATREAVQHAANVAITAVRTVYRVEPNLPAPGLGDALAALQAGVATFPTLREAVKRHRFSRIDTRRAVDDAFADFTITPGSFRDTIEALYWERVLTKEQIKELRPLARFLPAPTPENVAALAREHLAGDLDWESVLRLAADTTFTKNEPELHGTDNSIDPTSWEDTVGLILALPDDELQELRAVARFSAEA